MTELTALKGVVSVMRQHLDAIAKDNPNDADAIISGLNLRLMLYGTPPVGDDPILEKQREIWEKLNLSHPMGKEAFSIAAMEWMQNN